MIAKINNTPNTGDDDAQAVQKELSQMFSGLQNPTLPSAYRLRDAALANGYAVHPQMLQKLAQFEDLV